MNKLFVLFSVLITVGACSTAPTSNDPMIDAISDAANRVGGVAGFTAYEYKSSYRPETSLTARFVEMLYFKDSEFKMTSAEIFDGFRENRSFNNEVIDKFATAGTWTQAPEFTLVDSKTSTNIIDKNGFNKLYLLTSQASQRWMSKKIGGLDIWEESGARNYYLLMKEEGDNSFLAIWRARPDTADNTYTILASDLTNRSRQAVYNKK